MTTVTTVLLTGFEPFDGQPVNASWAAVREVAQGWTGPVRLVTARLPVSFARAPQDLAALIAEHRPELVVCVGEAGGRGRVSIERVGINVQDARIPDEDGDQPVDRPVDPVGPAAHFATLPVKAALVAAQATGTSVELSNTAGTFVCNTIAYAIGASGVRGGFVHVPRLPEQMPAGQPALSATESARAITAVLHAALSTAVDLPVSAGVES